MRETGLKCISFGGVSPLIAEHGADMTDPEGKLSGEVRN
jgi:hypothetical protein